MQLLFSKVHALKPNARGFTLIETLVYLALYAIVIGGALTGVYSLLESSARNQASAMIEEEGSYLIAKANWVMANTASVVAPAATGTAFMAILSDGSQAKLAANGGAIQLQLGASPPQTLQSPDVSVGSLSFVHAKASGNGLRPESVSVSFMLAATTSDGHALSRSFSSLNYLRR